MYQKTVRQTQFLSPLQVEPSRLPLFKFSFGQLPTPLFLLVLSLILFSNCQKEPPFVDPILQPYIDTFLEEANKRGQDISTNDLQAFLIPNIETAGIRVCGLGHSPIFGDNFRRIDIDPLCWEFANEAEREILVFHELGHALLDRIHNDWKLPNGRNRSIMFSGENCDIYASYNDCQVGLRTYYLDELFKEGITIPFWAKRQFINRPYFTDNFDRSKLGWKNILPTLNTTISQDSTTFVSAPYALKITTSTSGESNVWQREVPLSPIKICSNLTLSAMVKTENLKEGHLSIQVTYPSFDADNQPASICTHSFTIRETATSKEQFQQFEFGLFCVPGGKKDLDIQLSLVANDSSAVWIDDLSMQLWD